MYSHSTIGIIGIFLSGLLITGCASTSSSSNQALLDEISVLKKQQADTQQLLQKLQTQVEDYAFVARQALATAETAQEMSAASDDKLEQVFQITQFK